MENTTQMKKVNRKLFERAQAVARLMNMEKPDGFRSLSCRDFFHDQSRHAFGMVYEYPDLPADMKCELVTLDCCCRREQARKENCLHLKSASNLPLLFRMPYMSFTGLNGCIRKLPLQMSPSSQTLALLIHSALIGPTLLDFITAVLKSPLLSQKVSLLPIIRTIVIHNTARTVETIAQSMITTILV
jgi:hypothetical protein